MNIYTVGYPVMGEAVLSLICDKQKVLFTVLTDCYSMPDCNHVESVLQARGVGQIDVFVWTHPDKDHSVGICDLLNRFDRNHKAQVYLPMALHKGMSVGICAEAQDTLEYLTKHYNSARRYSVNPVEVTEQEVRSLISIKFTETFGTKAIHCRWNFVAPFGSLVWRRISNGTEFVLNNLSIVYSMCFNGINYLFCGDLSECAVRYISDECLQNVRFIKIPHHGSDEPKSFVRMLRQNAVCDAVAVTTSFRDTHPKTEVLDAYKGISREVYCTGDSVHADSLYGCVRSSFNIHSLACQMELSGNAFCYHMAK